MNLVCLYAGHTGVTRFFRGEKSTFEIYTVVLSGYTPIRASLYPLDRFFPIAMNYGFVTNRCYRSVSSAFERTKFCRVFRFLSRVIFMVPINGLAFPRIFSSLKEITVIAWILMYLIWSIILNNKSSIFFLLRNLNLKSTLKKEKCWCIHLDTFNFDAVYVSAYIWL